MDLLHSIEPEWYLDARIRLSYFKRFFERWWADQSFRRLLKSAPEEAGERYHLELDPHEVRACSQYDLLQSIVFKDVDDSHFPESLREFRRLEQHRRHTRHVMRQTWAPVEPRFQAWRERQIARVYNELGTLVARELDFGTANYELADGCSVGCWFCGVSAPRLGDLFLRTKANAQLWREVLEVMVEICGPMSARSHLMYWASDPFDNPDYEEFWLDFDELVGVLAHTTTALAVKDLERTRAFLELRRRRGGFMDRFSILSLKILDELHEAFSAEEMSHVQCAFQNHGAVLPKAKAGRFRDRALNRPGIEQHELDKFYAMPDEKGLDTSEMLPGTICCQAGFSLNLVRREVKLISPCRANPRWPDGTIIHGQESFRDAKELRKVLLKLIDEQMPSSVPPRRRVQFRSDLTYTLLDNGFQLSNHFRRKMTYTHRSLASYVVEAGQLIRTGRYTAQELTKCLFQRHAVFPGDTKEFLNQLHNKGLLSEEPESKRLLGPPSEPFGELVDPPPTLVDSINGAVQFLLHEQQRDGCWIDIQLSVGGSNEWITACVANALQATLPLGLQQDELNAALQNAARYLTGSRHQGGGWGFNKFSGVDADSTSTSLLFLLTHAHRDRDFESDMQLLLANQNADGGIGTFSPEEIQRQIEARNPNFSLPDVHDYKGWCVSDSYITAMALLALHGTGLENANPDAINRALDFIEQHQGTGGFWTAYWSTSRLLATYYCSRALSLFRAETAYPRLSRVCEWIASTQHSRGGWAGTSGSEPTPLDTALAIETLVRCDDKTYVSPIRRGLRWVSDAQLGDGSFESYAWMKVPLQWDDDLEKDSDRRVPDGKRLYTTAAVLRALVASQMVME